jgi:CheY-like chemotaxis protein
LEGRYQVVALTDPQLALERVRAGERFALVLVDLAMPDMTGREFMARLAELAPEQARRAVYVTGGPLDEETRRFLDETRPPMLQKPIDLEHLTRLVECATDSPFCADASARAGASAGARYS